MMKVKKDKVSGGEVSSLGKRIKQYRDRRGMTQYRLSLLAASPSNANHLHRRKKQTTMLLSYPHSLHQRSEPYTSDTASSLLLRYAE
jgi:hypothetical protein